MSITMHFATPEDVQRFFGTQPRTVRAIVFKRGDDIVGCAGLYLDQGRQVMFANLTDAVRKAPRLIVRGYRTLLAIAARSGLAVHAVPDPEVEASVRFLEHIGFRYLDRGVYEWRR